MLRKGKEEKMGPLSAEVNFDEFSKKQSPANAKGKGEVEEERKERREAPERGGTERGGIRWKTISRIVTSALLGAAVAATGSVLYDVLQEPAEEEGGSGRRKVATSQKSCHIPAFPDANYVFGALEGWNRPGFVRDVEVFRDIIRAEDLLLGTLNMIKLSESVHKLIGTLYFAMMHYSVAWSYSADFQKQVIEGLKAVKYKGLNRSKATQAWQYIYSEDFEPKWLALRAVLLSTMENIASAAKTRYNELRDGQDEANPELQSAGEGEDDEGDEDPREPHEPQF